MFFFGRQADCWQINAMHGSNIFQLVSDAWTGVSAFMTFVGAAKPADCIEIRIKTKFCVSGPAPQFEVGKVAFIQMRNKRTHLFLKFAQHRVYTYFF